MKTDAATTTTWPQLQGLAANIPSIAALFAADEGRSQRFTVEAAGLVADFSRQRVSPEVLALLGRMADELDLRSRISNMYQGAIANLTEHRQVLHTALRRTAAPHAELVVPERRRVLEFAEAVRAGTIRSSSGEPFELVVNVGIGGSDLGPAMAVEALQGLRVTRCDAARPQCNACLEPVLAQALASARSRAQRPGG